jgi:hypothetical protein
VPPEVTTGRVVVVVGGEVVCGVALDGVDSTVGEVVDVVASVVGDDGAVEGIVVVTGGSKVEVLFAGCSLATTTPMSTVAPAAAMKDARVRRLTRIWARRLVSGEW